MIKYAAILLGCILAPRLNLFFAPDTGGENIMGSSPRPSPPVNAPGAFGPGAVQPNPDREKQLRSQAKASAATLRAQAEARATDLSRATKQPVAPEVTATEEEIFQALMGGGEIPHDTPLHRTAGPNPGVAALRPGESATGPATGKLATAAPVMEHQVLTQGGVVPTMNAPGLGADTGLKLTADNPDARAGDGGHAAGVDPADKGTRGDVQVAEDRHDTVEEAGKRQSAVAALHQAVANGEVPTRQQFLDAGCPESEVDATIVAAEREIDDRKKSEAAAEEARAKAAETAKPAEKPAEPAEKPAPQAEPKA